MTVYPSQEEWKAFRAASKEGRDEPAIAAFLDAYPYLLDDRHAEMADRTMLHWAVANKCELLTRLLLERNVEVNRPFLGLTPLMTAVEKGPEVIVNMLLDHGADINAVGMMHGGRSAMTALIRAATLGRSSTVNILLERGADWRIMGFQGTAETAARLLGRIENAELLKQWPEILRLRQEKAHQRLLEGTDFSRGLKSSMPVPFPIFKRQGLKP
jgi:hypothetical protein